tara:strand:+ start:672 stop:1226 length:555 start_codon:yes stop_codon:yes gene_type:complete
MSSNHHSKNNDIVNLQSSVTTNSTGIATNLSTNNTQATSITTLNDLKPTITKLNESSTATAIFTDTAFDVTIFVNFASYGTPYYTLGSNSATEYISTIDVTMANTGSADSHVFKLGTDNGASTPFFFGTITEDDGTYSPSGVGAITRFTLTPAASTGHASYEGVIYWGDLSGLAFSACCVVRKF